MKALPRWRDTAVEPTRSAWISQKGRDAGPCSADRAVDTSLRKTQALESTWPKQSTTKGTILKAKSLGGILS